MSEDDPVPAELDDEVAAEIDDDEATVDVGEEDAAAAFNFSGPPNRLDRPARPTAKPKDPDKSLKAAAVPILATVGFLMLCLTGWALLILLNSHVWLWDRPNAKMMAVVMLMCGPIAAALFGGSFVFFRQIQREKEAYKLATAKPSKPSKSPPPAPRIAKAAAAVTSPLPLWERVARLGETGEG